MEGVVQPPDVVSYWYFGASLSVWFITPLVALLFDTCLSTVHVQLFTSRLHGLKRACHPAVFYPIKALAAYVTSAVMVYVFVPCYDMYLSFLNLFCHKKFKEPFVQGYDISHATKSAELPAKKLAEQCGEAIPQFLIAVVFYSKNAHWLSYGEVMMGGLTMTLSCGSIIFGVVNGIIAHRRS